MRVFVLITLLLTSFTFDKSQTDVHTATWYDTTGHPKVHREYSTAAYNHLPLKSKVIVVNLSNNKSDTVEITDRMGNKSQNRIDLSKKSFGKLANHQVGRIRVKVIPIEKGSN
jgi:rare lipoprotein A